jgi:hypothetical protein
MQRVAVPPELKGLKINYLHQTGPNELHSSCPKCGGAVHSDGSWPDRFIILIKSETTGGLFAFCRSCGLKWSPKRVLTQQQKNDWVKERREIEERIKCDAEKAIELLSKEQIWEQYHNNLDGKLRQYYYDKKITDYWIDYWALGYCADKTVGTKQGLWHTPTLTIPIFEAVTKRVLNIRHRLLNPNRPDDKYRPDRTGLRSALYLTNYEKQPEGKVLLVEGEFKAMTTFIVLDDPNISVVGIPGKMPDLAMLDQLKDCEVIYLCLDPDAYTVNEDNKISAADRLSAYFDDRARIIRVPFKIDDMVIKGYLDKNSLKQLLNTSRMFEQRPRTRNTYAR